MLELSEEAVIESSDILLNGQAEEIQKALVEESASFKEMDDLDREKTDNYGHTGENKDPENDRRAIERRRINNEIATIETGIRERLSKKFPILADPKLDLRDIYRNHSNKDSIPELEEHLREHLGWVFENIHETRRVLRENPDQIFKLEKLIELAKQQMGWIPLMDQIVDEKVSEVRWEDFMKSIGLAVVSLGLMLFSFGTLTPAALAIVATSSVIVSGIDVYYTYQNYTFEKTTGGTSLDPNMALSSTDPSVIWVVASIFGVIADFASFAKVFDLASLAKFSKTGTGADEIYKNFKKEKILAEGISEADFLKFLEHFLEVKRAVKRELLKIFKGKPLDLNHIDELADIYMAQNFNRFKDIKNFKDLEAFLKVDVQAWYNDFLKNGSKLVDDDGLKESGKFEQGVTNVNLTNVLKKVEFGSEELSQFAISFRKTLAVPNHRGNIAVFEYVDNSGNLVKKAFSTEVGIPAHSEELAIDFFGSEKIPFANIKRIYSELEPCELAGHACKFKLAENFPNAEKSFSYDYPGGADNTIRVASVNQRFKDLENLLK